jgi:hypothetical protein
LLANPAKILVVEKVWGRLLAALFLFAGQRRRPIYNQKQLLEFLCRVSHMALVQQMAWKSGRSD